MDKVGIVLKIMPKSPEVDLEELEARINEKVEPKKMRREPIAFGLQAVILNLVADEVEGVTDDLEKKIKSIKGVGEVSVESTSRLPG